MLAGESRVPEMLAYAMVFECRFRSILADVHHLKIDTNDVLSRRIVHNMYGYQMCEYHVTWAQLSATIDRYSLCFVALPTKSIGRKISTDKLTWDARLRMSLSHSIRYKLTSIVRHSTRRIPCPFAGQLCRACLTECKSTRPLRVERAPHFAPTFSNSECGLRYFRYTE